MNHRERVLSALQHKEPDRIPIDLGGHSDSTILAAQYNALRQALGLAPVRIKLLDPALQTAAIDDEVREVLGIDTAFVNIAANEYCEGALRDGTKVFVPAGFNPIVREDGSQVILDASGRVVSLMPATGFYFDSVYLPLAEATSVFDIDKVMRDIETYDWPEYCDQSYEALAEQARLLRERTDYLIVGYFGGHIFQAGQGLRGWDTFLMDLVANRPFAQALLERVTDANIRRFDQFARTLGPYVDVIQFEEDLGMQDRPFLRPSMYRELIKPHHARLYGYAKKHCGARLLLHSDGAVAPMIPDFIEMGIDILNPVQVSAAGMDTRALKRDFGKDLSFWGAGCDSQSTLPFGTVQEVIDETKRHIDDMAPGGGYVFASIHNIQPGVPTANILAMFRTAREYGVYHK